MKIDLPYFSYFLISLRILQLPVEQNFVCHSLQSNFFVHTILICFWWNPSYFPQRQTWHTWSPQWRHPWQLYSSSEQLHRTWGPGWTWQSPGRLMVHHKQPLWTHKDTPRSQLEIISIKPNEHILWHGSLISVVACNVILVQLRAPSDRLKTAKIYIFLIL